MEQEFEYETLEDSITQIHGFIKQVTSNPQKKTTSLYDQYGPNIGDTPIFFPYMEFEVESDTHPDIELIKICHYVPLRPGDEIYAYLLKAEKVNTGTVYAPEIALVDRPLEMVEQACKIELILDGEVRATYHTPFDL